MSEPIHIISLGAGVQSSTMALMAAHGEITPMPKCAIFADTQDEPQSVYTWLDWLEKQLPFPVHRVTAGSLSDNILKLKRSGRSGKMYGNTYAPFFTSENGHTGILGRRCTSDFKVVPLTRKVKELIGKSGTAIQWIGISLDEVHRMKPSKNPRITHRWPLVDGRISRHDCMRWMEANGYPKPPRSACAYCPYHSDNEWRRLRNDEPEAFEKAIAFEREVQRVYKGDEVTRGTLFLHRSCVPLDQVDFSTDEDHGQQVMFGNECEGMCGV